MNVRQKIKFVAAGLAAAGLAGCASSAGTPGPTRAGLLMEKSYVDKDYRRAREYYERGQFEQAKEFFEQFIAGHHGHALQEIALYYLGSCFQETDDYTKALSTYQRLIDEYREGFWVELARQEMKSILRLGS